MTFVHAGTLGTVPGKRDELVARLTERNDALRDLGCRRYEVGTNDQQPDTVFVIEVWDTAAAHRAALQQPDVIAAIAAARPLLDGQVGGFQFTVAGSPLHDP
jgi:quinol monooxygenase YgiN